MRRPADSRWVFAVSLLAAVILLHSALSVAAAAVRAAGGLGLAQLYFRRGEAPVELEIHHERPEQERQVVEIDRPPAERVPDKARFASEWNSRVKKETQAVIKSLKPVALISGRPQERPPEPDSRAFVEKRRTLLESAIKLKPVPGPSPLAMRQETTNPTSATPAPSPEARSPKDSPWKKKLSLRDLTPKTGVLAKVLPSAFPDYLKDIEQGQTTLLNSKRFKFASFFNRVKRAVAQHWHPGREYQRRDPKGNVYGFKTRYTVLHVILHADGRLKRLVLERPCGLGFLDDEARRAFRRAAPFPNPPRRLINRKTGQIAFRFGFIFELKQSPTWRIIRLK